MRDTNPGVGEVTDLRVFILPRSLDSCKGIASYDPSLDGTETSLLFHVSRDFPDISDKVTAAGVSIPN